MSFQLSPGAEFVASGLSLNLLLRISEDSLSLCSFLLIPYYIFASSGMKYRILKLWLPSGLELPSGTDANLVFGPGFKSHELLWEFSI